MSKQINKQAHTILLQNGVINTGHTGISIFEPATNSYWYNYNADKYFVPASNVKLFTLYAGMKYLGDSLIGARVEDKGATVNVYGTGDPTLLEPHFVRQPVIDFLKSKKGATVYLTHNEDYKKIGELKEYGSGWAWDDYQESYMPERSFFPIYGNTVKFYLDSFKNLHITPPFFNDYTWYNQTDTSVFKVVREKAGNSFFINGSRMLSKVSVPFKTIESYHTNKFIANMPAQLLSDTLGFKVYQSASGIQFKTHRIIHSQPTDSLLTPMMHNSDNFFAEQTLLMVSNERLGYMSDETIIDTLLKTDLKDIPQKPRWVDGSGLSRYNLFTPQSFVYILNKMQNEFGLNRLKAILPTGGEGTLKNYYNSDSGFIYAKTGSLSNQVSFCGFLITKKNKLLVFSVLTNNVMGDGSHVRRACEKFIKAIREQY